MHGSHDNIPLILLTYNAIRYDSRNDVQLILILITYKQRECDSTMTYR